MASTQVGDPLGWPAEVKTLIRGEISELQEFFFLASIQVDDPYRESFPGSNPESEIN